MKAAIVLGAGGALGWVFHAGVVGALAEATGIDGRSADLVIGTSAGAAVGASLRAGCSPDEVVEAALRRPSKEEEAEMRAQLRAAGRSFRPLAPRLLSQVLPGGNGAAVALAGLVPPGRFPTSFANRFPGLSGIGEWPAGLWIPAVRSDTGAVVVFGRDRVDVTVRGAVEASSAIPGVFRPKRIDGIPFIDGGLASPTNAGLAVSVAPDLVIVSSPMTRPSRRPMAVHARRRLAQERAALEAAGIDVVTVEAPTILNDIARGFPGRNPEAAPAILTIAAEATRRALAGAGLTSAPRRMGGSLPPARLAPIAETS